MLLCSIPRVGQHLEEILSICVCMILGKRRGGVLASERVEMLVSRTADVSVLFKGTMSGRSSLSRKPLHEVCAPTCRVRDDARACVPTAVVLMLVLFRRECSGPCPSGSSPDQLAVSRCAIISISTPSASQTSPLVVIYR